MKIILVFSFVLTLLAFACNDNAENPSENEATISTTPVISYSVASRYPHDTASFTEGLSVYKGQLYESTGQPNTSWLGPVDSATGKILRKIILSGEFFGEGMTILNDKVYWLTWQSKKGFIYDLHTWKKTGEFTYPPALKEGWGLTNDGTYLIASSGSSKLFYLDPQTLTLVKTVNVSNDLGALPNINELEYINGYIFCNQWQTSYIYKIDPSTGKVLGRMDLKDAQQKILATHPGFNFEDNVLNGIAYDSSANKILITGKRWPEMFEIKIP